MQIDGPPVTGVLEMGPYHPNRNQAALEALQLPADPPRIQLIPADVLRPGYTHAGHPVTQQVMNVHMSVGTHMFWAGPVQTFPRPGCREPAASPHTDHAAESRPHSAGDAVQRDDPWASVHWRAIREAIAMLEDRVVLLRPYTATVLTIMSVAHANLDLPRRFDTMWKSLTRDLLATVLAVMPPLAAQSASVTAPAATGDSTASRALSAE